MFDPTCRDLPMVAQTRQVLDSVFLEACLENATRGPLALEYVRLDPAPGMLVRARHLTDSTHATLSVRGMHSTLGWCRVAPRSALSWKVARYHVVRSEHSALGVVILCVH